MGLKLNDQTILVIDDEQEILDVVRELLERHDYRVLTAASGQEGLDLIRKEKIHLILLDIMMPKMSGFEVLSELKRNPETASIPVVILTARMEVGMIVEAKQLGAVDYVVKPFQPDDLIKWIKVYERHDPKKPPEAA
ncbi:MAG TPA: response regulator [Candidatus Omnitrophota bacterium]|nr:response regulator [Candidatus Omnitrophota bacterium]